MCFLLKADIPTPSMLTPGTLGKGLVLSGPPSLDNGRVLPWQLSCVSQVPSPSLSIPFSLLDGSFHADS